MRRGARHKSAADPLELARASRPLCRGHPFATLRAGSARALLDLRALLTSFPEVKTSLAAGRDPSQKL